MIDREFEELLSKYEVTHWDPCKGICVIGKCEQSSTVGCCPTIHIPIVPTPTPTGNIIKSEFVIDNNKDVYYVDVAGNSILLEKVTTLTDTINGHQIGVYFNELQAPVTLNETVTSMGVVTLTGTILNIPYTDENGNTIVRSVDLSGLSGGSSGSYTSDNGLTTTGTNHQLGGNLVKHTVIDGVDQYNLYIDNISEYRVRNITGSFTSQFEINNNIPSGNKFIIRDLSTNLENGVRLDPTIGANLYTVNNGTSEINQIYCAPTELRLDSGSGVGSGAISTGIRLTPGEITLEVKDKNYTIYDDVNSKVLGISNTEHFQRNMFTGYKGYILNTENVSGGTKGNIRLARSGAALGTIVYRPSGHLSPSKEDGVIVHQNTAPTFHNVPDATTMSGKVIEIRAFGTDTVTLDTPVYLGPSTTMTVLQPYGSNSYNNPTYIKILSDGIKWIVVNQW